MRLPASLGSLGKGSGLHGAVAVLARHLGSRGGDGGLAARCSCWWAGESVRAASGEASLRSPCVPTREGRGWPRPRVFGGRDKEAVVYQRGPKAGFESGVGT